MILAPVVVRRCVAFLILLLSSFWTKAAETASSVQQTISHELARRQKYAMRGKEAMASAAKAMQEKDFELAASQYKLACDLIPAGESTRQLHDNALNGFCEASCRFAEQRIAEGRYSDARDQLKLVLAEQYDPRCQKALRLLSRLETPGYYNQTVGPAFRGKIDEVKKLLAEAEGFCDAGRYDLAMQRYDQVLNLDRYNMVARAGQEKVNLARNQYSNAAYNETRSRLLWQLDSAWQSSVRNFDSQGDIGIYQDDPDAAGTAQIMAKLQRIILPKLELRDATIAESLDFLKKKTIELDPDPDPSRRGISFVLKLDAGTGALPSSEPPTATPPTIPGLEQPPGGTPPAANPAGKASVVSAVEGRITLSLSNIPVIEAVRYIASLARLKYKVERYAVAIVPLSVNTVELIQKEYKVPPGFIARVARGGGEAAGLASTPPSDATKGGAAISGRMDTMEFLKGGGVTFPEGGIAIYIPTSSRLIVRNTRENLDLIDQLIAAFSVGGPSQVEIEAKFVEITQQNLDELSFDWLLGQANVPGSAKIFTGGGTSGTSSGLAAADSPFIDSSGNIVGSNPVTSGLRSGNNAINQNAIDALLAGISGASSKAPAIGAISGVFTDPQFQFVMRGLSQKKGVDVLSAPRVTTKSGQRAIIEIIREFRYPTEFDPPQIPQSFGNSNTNGSSATGGSSDSFPVTPTTPTSFETRNTGVTLEVEPVVGPDGFTIELNLAPQVVEFEGFVNYGSPIQGSSTNTLGVTTTTVITPNIINQPIFSTRKVTTSVSVFDGQTVVIGGLMREDIQKVEDKVPLLGDIPLLGRLFRSNVDRHIKRNLVIFVSARLVNHAGDPLRPDEEAEETIGSRVEPVPANEEGVLLFSK